MVFLSARLAVEGRAVRVAWKDCVSPLQTPGKPPCQRSHLRAGAHRHAATNEVTDLRWFNQPWKWCRAASGHWYSLNPAVYYLILCFRARQDLAAAEGYVQQSELKELICPHGSQQH